jgi:excisionase family DNA binding protein
MISMTDRRPLYVRLPESEALRLDEAAHRLKRSKQDLVASLITAYGDPETLRRVTVEDMGDRLTVGHAEFRPFSPPDVLTVDELAAWLQTDAETVAKLADDGELPGRKLGDEWRFARDAVLDWLARR